jgi:hypothetical protein
MNHIFATCPGGGQVADAKHKQIAAYRREQITAGPRTPSAPKSQVRQALATQLMAGLVRATHKPVTVLGERHAGHRA